ncbi:polysaccharide biosynthesis protein [Sphingobium sp. SCG-1]|uniref:oligosaccharide flippase family protein n=1 Tax=Sphingobium sp. SCG-1 TaxID=2072936 RepID=UPI000CD69165|nr:oligosaccharide flippase family protein [Sphingobium sp. SCG-1]AUW59605.1 polysaccharide biosynthesis protein [Sphingobium sp. SCG-1]
MSIKKSLAWMGGAQIVALILQFASTIVLARYLTLHEAGIYAVALSLVAVLALVQHLGLQALIVREEVLTREISTTAFTVNALISIALSGVIMATSLAGGRLLGDPGVQRALGVLAISPLFQIFVFLPAATLEREGQFKQIALVNTAGAVCGAIATIILVLGGFSYMSVPYAQLVNGAVTAVLMSIVGSHHVSFRIGFHAWRRVGDFGLQMLAVSGINSLSTRLSDIVLARFLGLSALGVYNRASGLNGMIWTNVHLLIGRVMLVDYAALYRSGGSLRERYLRTVEIVTALLWPMFIGFAVIAKPFILIVYGERWIPAAVPLALIMLASAIQVAITMTWELFAATGQLRVQTRIEFIRSGVALAAFVGGCLISLEAAAAARVIDALFALMLYRPHLDRMTETTIRDFWSIYGRSALLTLLACGPAGLLTIAMGFSAQIPVVLLIAAIAIGIVLWVGGLFVLRHPLVAEIRKRSKPLSA